MLRQARTLSPTDPLVEIRLARSQQEAGKGDDAIRTLQAAVTKFPKEPAVKLSLASTLERERKYSEAEAVFRQMIADDPKNADALNSLGYMLAERGQKLDEAVGARAARARDRAGQRRLSRQPRLGLLQAEPARAGRGARCEKRRSSCPTVSVIQDHLGDLLNKRGSLEEAIAAWQKALDGDGDSISRSELDDKIKSARQKLGRKK